jgi:hypothetical protein
MKRPHAREVATRLFALDAGHRAHEADAAASWLGAAAARCWSAGWEQSDSARGATVVDAVGGEDHAGCAAAYAQAAPPIKQRRGSRTQRRAPIKQKLER